MFHVNKKGKSRLQWDKVQDTGTRSAFGTGSQRDTQEGKGRFDLIPSTVLRRLAQHYENGALKYGDNNWQKGQPLKQYLNSAMRHLLAIEECDLTEDHFAAVIWNIASMIHHIDKMLDGELPVELDSFGFIEAIQKEEQELQLTQYQYESKEWSPNTYTWIPVTMSGQMDDAINEALDKIKSKKVWDKDRFSKLGEMNDFNEEYRK